jgi:hypothetical protein
MNRRIRALAKQATGASTIYMLEEEWEKFAELIVAECVEIVRDTLRDETSDLSYATATDIQNNIKQLTKRTE